MEATQQPIYTTLDKLYGVKISVPATGAPWLVGVLNIITNEIEPLGKGAEGVKKGISYQPKSTEEIVVFTVGTNVRDNGRNVIVNRTFSDLSCVDFGKNVNCAVEVKTKQIGERKFTALSLTKANGQWKYELKFSENGKHPEPTEGMKSYKVEGTNAQINIIPIKQPTATNVPAETIAAQ